MIRTGITWDTTRWQEWQMAQMKEKAVKQLQTNELINIKKVQTDEHYRRWQEWQMAQISFYIIVKKITFPRKGISSPVSKMIIICSSLSYAKLSIISKLCRIDSKSSSFR